MNGRTEASYLVSALMLMALVLGVLSWPRKPPRVQEPGARTESRAARQVGPAPGGSRVLVRDDEAGEALAEPETTLANPLAPTLPALFSPETSLGRLLNEHAQLVTMTFDTLAEAHGARERSLASLRVHADAVARVLAESYAELPQERFDARWLVASTLAALERDAAYEPLRDIALEPSLILGDTEAQRASSRAQELALRLLTTNALATLAERGNAQAEADLWDMIEGSAEVAEPVRLRAIRAYVRAGGEPAASSARDVLPVELHWALDAREFPPRARVASLSSTE